MAYLTGTCVPSITRIFQDKNMNCDSGVTDVRISEQL